MGIDLWNLQFLLEAYRLCGPMGDTVQIGRQELHVPPQAYDQADELFRRAGLDIGYQQACGGQRYADQGLLQSMGATNVRTADASAYEGADIVHDFNDPIDPGLHQAFDTVFDAGSLEHIFNVPGAIANEMNMVKVGGRLLSTLPANNWLGHGFYQFSQEFPYRVFTPSNGFTVLRAFFSEMADNHEFLVIEDLFRRAGGEIGRTTTNTGLLVIAPKTAHVPLFKRWPQQGDYHSEWEKHGDASDAPAAASIAGTQAAAPASPGLLASVARKLGLAG
jgi:hypothetical protein